MLAAVPGQYWAINCWVEFRKKGVNESQTSLLTVYSTIWDSDWVLSPWKEMSTTQVSWKATFGRLSKEAEHDPS